MLYFCGLRHLYHQYAILEFCIDPAFIGAACAAPEGKICGPVAGTIASYVFKVTGRDTGAFYTEDDANNYVNQKNQYMSQMILPVMMELCDVKDNRARFY